MSDVFTQQDAEQIRGRFKCSADERITIDKVEPHGRFMNIFMTQKRRCILPFPALGIMTYVLDKTLSCDGWEPVQAYVLRDDSGIVRYRVRIEKNN